MFDVYTKEINRTLSKINITRLSKLQTVLKEALIKNQEINIQETEII